MSTSALHRPRAVNRVTFAVALSLAALVAGAAGRAMVTEETAQAHAYVAEAQRALAQGDRAAGVLSLERARFLAPREPNVRSALSAAHVAEPEPFPVRAARLLTSREWSAIAAAFGWISGLGILLAVARWHRRHAARAALAAGFAFMVGMAGTMASNASTPGVVTGAATQLLVAPYSGAVTEEALPTGTVVVMGSRYDDFVHVKTSDGQSGWVPRGRVEAVAGSDS